MKLVMMEPVFCFLNPTSLVILSANKSIILNLLCFISSIVSMPLTGIFKWEKIELVVCMAGLEILVIIVACTLKVASYLLLWPEEAGPTQWE